MPRDEHNARHFRMEKASMKLVAWNVNSLKVRLPKVLQWLEMNPVDVLCIQETKLTDDKFPQSRDRSRWLSCRLHWAKTYNGVAILRVIL